MKHVRQKLRERIKADLIGLAGGRVYTTRIYPKSTLPAIAIYANTETSANENPTIGSPRRYSRRVDITIEITAKAAVDVDDDVDDLAAQAEALLGGDITLNNLATDSELLSTTHSTSGDGDGQLMTARLLYRIWYRTTATDAETAL